MLPVTSAPTHAAARILQSKCVRGVARPHDQCVAWLQLPHVDPGRGVTLSDQLIDVAVVVKASHKASLMEDCSLESRSISL